MSVTGQISPHSSLEDSQSLSEPELDLTNIYVRQLPKSLNDSKLHALCSNFGQVVSAKVMVGRNQRSLGYGFVRFSTELEAETALSQLNGIEVDGNRLMAKYSYLTKETEATKPQSQLYVKPLPLDYKNDELLSLFAPFGTVVRATVLVDMQTGLSRQVGFVEMETVDGAEKALKALNGLRLGSNTAQLTVRYAESTEDKQQRLKKRKKDEPAVHPKPAPVSLGPRITATPVYENREHQKRPHIVFTPSVLPKKRETQTTPRPSITFPPTLDVSTSISQKYHPNLPILIHSPPLPVKLSPMTQSEPPLSTHPLTLSTTRENNIVPTITPVGIGGIGQGILPANLPTSTVDTVISYQTTSPTPSISSLHFLFTAPPPPPSNTGLTFSDPLSTLPESHQPGQVSQCDQSPLSSTIESVSLNMPSFEGLSSAFTSPPLRVSSLNESMYLDATSISSYGVSHASSPLASWSSPLHTPNPLDTSMFGMTESYLTRFHSQDPRLPPLDQIHSITTSSTVPAYSSDSSWWDPAEGRSTSEMLGTHNAIDNFNSVTTVDNSIFDPRHKNWLLDSLEMLDMTKELGGS
ncbi:putative Polyadenylate-binding protein [Blattamonas nauphoetae]|uniref:Polyadenylate-binding protein n=1 Tax=Blattamonas nauphoetae TaxID=2049346 RepID=A0ABQ9Y701_9EUKA|nr:putative Polyadenylate-binding protein [Blattamonas nauphoetae]